MKAGDTSQQQFSSSILENSPLIPDSIVRSQDRINLTMQPFNPAAATDLQSIPYRRDETLE